MPLQKLAFFPLISPPTNTQYVGCSLLVKPKRRQSEKGNFEGNESMARELTRVQYATDHIQTI